MYFVYAACDVMTHFALSDVAKCHFGVGWSIVCFVCLCRL